MTALEEHGATAMVEYGATAMVQYGVMAPSHGTGRVRSNDDGRVQRDGSGKILDRSVTDSRVSNALEAEHFPVVTELRHDGQPHTDLH